MKRKMLGFVTLFLGVTAIAAAQGRCTNASAAGHWGYTITGTLLLPTGAVPIAAVGSSMFDDAGNFSGTQTSSVGSVSEETVKGTITLNPDCTGTVSVSVFDQSGNLLRTAEWSLVLVDHGTEARAIFKKLALANGTPVPAVITVNSKKVVPGRSE